MKHGTLIATVVVTVLLTIFFATSLQVQRRPTVMKVLSYNGIDRTYWEHVPISYDGSQPVPLVIMPHGAGGNGELADRASGWSILAEAHGFIAVFPNGGPWWNAYDWVNPRDDVGFLMALIDKLKTDYLIDETRVYLTGHSNGASMVISLTFKHTDVLAAIAAASGPWMTGDRMYDIDPYAVPQPKAPIPVYVWRGEIESWPSSQEDELQKQYWIEWNHVNKTPKIVTEGAYTTEIYAGGDAEVRFTEIKNRGHNTYDLGTARKIWNDFFSRLSRDTIHDRQRGQVWS